MDELRYEIRLIENKTGDLLNVVRSMYPTLVSVSEPLAHSTLMSPTPNREGFYELVSTNEVITHQLVTQTVTVAQAEGSSPPDQFPMLRLDVGELNIRRVRSELPEFANTSHEGPTEWRFDLDGKEIGRQRTAPVDTVRSVFVSAMSAVRKRKS